MHIDDDWKLVLPITDSVQVFHSPITKAVFEANFRLLSATKADIFGHGNQYAFLSGLNVAALTLKDIGKRLSDERGQEGDYGAQSFLGELQRCSTILAPGANGYDILPVGTALAQGTLDADDWADVENELVFFTCAACLSPRKARKAVAQAMADLLECSLTSLSCEEYARGLTISVRPATANPAAQVISSIPT